MEGTTQQVYDGMCLANTAPIMVVVFGLIVCFWLSGMVYRRVLGGRR